eukprot:9281538-Ditylum_brightwellii.AAC.1
MSTTTQDDNNDNESDQETRVAIALCHPLPCLLPQEAPVKVKATVTMAHCQVEMTVKYLQSEATVITTVIVGLRLMMGCVLKKKSMNFKMGCLILIVAVMK